MKKGLALRWICVQVVLTSVLILLSKHIFNLGTDPLNFSYQILFVAGIYLLLYSLIREPQAIINIKGKSLFYIILVGLTSGGLTYTLGFTGLKHSSAINYAFLTQITLVFTPLMAYCFLRESLKLDKILLMISITIGSYLVSTSGAIIIPEAGDILLLLGALAFSAGTILSKIVLRAVPTITFSMYRSFFGSFFIAFFLLTTGNFNFPTNWSLVVLVGLIVASGILAMNKVLEYATASYMSMMYILVSVLTTVLAIIFLNETMTLVQAVGGMIIIFSGILIHKKDV